MKYKKLKKLEKLKDDTFVSLLAGCGHCVAADSRGIVL